MCGIVGCFSRDPSSLKDLGKALDLMRNRGPDDRGTWQDDHLRLGSVRLAILDLSRLGRQPMTYGAGRYVVVFNGAIYNYLELRAELERLGHRFVSGTDTEVLPAAFAEWGVRCPEKLRGMFAFAIYDTKERSLFLARDRTGEKPLYYWRDDRTFCFASEMKSLISIFPGKFSLDPAAVDLFLHYQYVPEPGTPLSGINKLQSSHYLRLDFADWTARPTRYWDMEDSDPVRGDPVKLIKKELFDIIPLTLRSDVPVGIALSGGLDSGAISCLASASSGRALSAFTVGYEQKGPHDEREEAKELSKSLKMPYHEVELRTGDFVDFFPELVSVADDPIADIAAYGYYAVNRLASEHGVKVMLNGFGGDELFWGYPWCARSAALTCRKKEVLFGPDPVPAKKAWLPQKLTASPLYCKLMCHPRVPGPVRGMLSYGAGDGILNLDHPEQMVFYQLSHDFAAAAREVGRLYAKGFGLSVPSGNSRRIFDCDLSGVRDVPVRICRMVFDTWLVSNCLSLGDRVSMRSSVESRTPLLDHKLIELVIGLRKSFPDHDLGPKHWFKSALEGVVPDSLVKRRKRGFQPPVTEWMSELVKKYGRHLMSGYLVDSGIIERAALAGFIERSRAHLATLYKLLVLEVWCRRVMLGETRFP